MASMPGDVLGWHTSYRNAQTILLFVLLVLQNTLNQFPLNPECMDANKRGFHAREIDPLLDVQALQPLA
jgi:hypothetical protein